MTWRIGEQIGGYEIIDQLGQGGMATVYKAYHAQLDRHVAIKVIHPNFSDDESFVSRFSREAQIVAKLEHPNIVPVYDYNKHENRPYLVMKYIEGETLKERLNKSALPIEEIMHIMSGVAHALTYAHNQGVLHRDVKPSNIVLDKNGHPYLTDFGLARMVKAGQSTLSADMLLGTPHYISPEQAKGQKEIDGRTDVYSFGVVLYELFVGDVPYTADSYYAIINDHINTPTPVPSLINPEIPDEISDVLIKVMAKKPAQRYETADLAMTELSKAVKIVGLTKLNENRASLAQKSLSRLRDSMAIRTDDEEEYDDYSQTPRLKQQTKTPTPVYRTATVSQIPSSIEPINSGRFWVVFGLTTFILAFFASIFVLLGMANNLGQISQIIASNPAFVAQNDFVMVEGLANSPDFIMRGVTVTDDYGFPIFNLPQVTLEQAQQRQSENPTEGIDNLVLANAYWQNGQIDMARAQISTMLRTSRNVWLDALNASYNAQNNGDYEAELVYLLYAIEQVKSDTVLISIIRPYVGESIYRLAKQLPSSSLPTTIETVLGTDTINRLELRDMSQGASATLFLGAQNAFIERHVVARTLLARIPDRSMFNAERDLLLSEIEVQQNNYQEAEILLKSLTDDSTLPQWIISRANVLLEQAEENS